MEFRQAIDFSQFDPFEVAYVVITDHKGIAMLFNSRIKREAKPGLDVEAIRLIIGGIGGARDAYNYVVKNHTRKVEMLSYEVPTHVMVNVGVIKPIATQFTQPILLKNVEDSMDDIQDFMKNFTCITPVEQAQLAKEFNCEVGGTTTTTTNVAGKHLMININKDVYVAPLVMGDVVFDTAGAGFLSANNVEATHIKSKELVVAHAIVDLTRLKLGEVIPKTLAPKLKTFDEQDLAQIENLVVEVQSIFGKALKKQGSQRGRTYMKTILLIMLDSQTTPGYVDFVVKWAKWILSGRHVRTPSKLGEYNLSTLDYARELLAMTRGVRGGDDKDSTSVGLASYLDFNVPRSVVKILARAQDIMRVCVKLKVAEISIIGKNAKVYVDSILAVNIKLNYIGFSQPGSLQGWTENNGLYTSNHHQATVGTTIKGLIINVDLVKKKTLVNSNSYVGDQVQLVEAPLDFTNYRYMPSVLLHNLTGFLLPKNCTPVPLKSVKKIKGKILKSENLQEVKENDNQPNGYGEMVVVANSINIIRTYPSLFSRFRACTLMAKYKYPVLDPTLYRRFVNTSKETSFSILFSNDAINLELIDLMSQHEIDKLVKDVDTFKSKFKQKNNDDDVVVNEGKVDESTDDSGQVEEEGLGEF